MARIMNLGLWSKAYMLEFVSTMTEAAKIDTSEIFTFALPPESEKFDYPQRISETKTFGGAVFDDYGNDTYRITLSGSTVNNEKKLIYKGNKALPGYLTGEQEIFALQSLIKKYGELDNLENKKVYLYDLSKMTLLDIAAATPVERAWWRVHIKDLQINRSKEKPYTYNYTLEMIAYKDSKPKGKSLFGDGFQSFVENVQNIASKINDVVSTVELATAAIGSVREKTVEVANLFEQFSSDNLNGFEKLSLATGLVGSSERLFIGTSTISAAYNATKELLLDVDTVSNLAGEDLNAAGTFTGTNKGGSISDDEKYTVTFDANGGYFDDESQTAYKESVSYSNMAQTPNTPTRENYEFEYWYILSSPETEYSLADNPIKSDITLHAKWKQTKAVVTFNSRGGTSVSSQTVDIGGVATRPSENPTRSGYSFNQWCSNFAATTVFNFETPIIADTTVYASWTRITAVTVTFESNGGSPVESQSVEPGNKLTYPVTPNKENYIFAGWYIDKELSNPFDFIQSISSSCTLYAKWTHTQCNVSFESSGGSSVESQKVYIGSKAEKPSNPEKSGYTFAYWCSDSAATNEFDFNTGILSDITLYARWVLNTYEVVFESNGGDSIESQNVTHGNLAEFPSVPTKENYSFYMWCKDKYLNEEFDFSTPITSDVTLYARWFGSSYTFSFESNGGTEFDSQTVSHGSTAEEKRPTKEGNAFDGWFVDEEFTTLFSFDTPIVHDMTIYAKWIAEQRTITFESNGGTEVEAQTVDYGLVATEPDNPILSGSTFEGWYTDEELTQKYDFSTLVTENITLYAKWS